MNARTIYRLMMTLPLVLLWGCINNLAEEQQQTQEQTQEQTQDGETPSITLEYDAITLSAGGYYGTIAIHANVDYRITATASYSWLSFEKRDEGVYLKLDKNDSEETRGIILYIENSQYGLEKTLTVVQEGGTASSGTTDEGNVDDGNNGYVDDEPATTTHQCMAITQKGTQCKRNAMEGSDYCWQHQPDTSD